MYQPRTYRLIINSPDLITYNVVEQETDLLISTVSDLSRQARQIVHQYREDLQSFVRKMPYFASSLVPVSVPMDSPSIVIDMAKAANAAGVGPMATVAGAIAQYLGKELAVLSSEVIVENGGDIFLKSHHKRIVAIYAGNSPFTDELGLEIGPQETPLGICTSSATVGPSLSFGKTNATVVVAPSALLADAAATAIGNVVSSAENIRDGLARAQSIPGLTGTVIILGDRLGAWGRIRFRRLKIH